MRTAFWDYLQLQMPWLFLQGLRLRIVYAIQWLCPGIRSTVSPNNKRPAEQISSIKLKRSLNTLRPTQNGHRFADDIFKRIYLNENVRSSIKISLKFVLRSPVNNIPALIQIMAWRRPGDKPLSEAMMIISLTHICVTRQNELIASINLT